MSDVTWVPFTRTRLTEGDVIAGYIITHPALVGCLYPGVGCEPDQCCGSIHVRPNPDQRPVWNVISKEPLTLSPSIECKCKSFHGHIINGEWIPA